MPTATRAALGLALLLAAGCSAPPPPTKRPARPHAIRVDRGVLGAFRDYLYAGYDLLLARERPQKAEVERLSARHARARDALEKALLAKGAAPSQVATVEGMVHQVREGIERGNRYALIGAPDGTVSVVRIRSRKEPRTITLFGEAFTYERTIHDEVIVLDYPAYRAMRLEQPYPRQTATYRVGGERGTVRIDRASAEMVGEQLFLPRVEALRASARRARDVGAYLRAKKHLAALLTLTKDALRWRSLEPLWSMIASLPRAEQLSRFVDDYTSRAELRAAAELREATRLAHGRPMAELSAAERTRLFELGSLSAAIHGDPLGQMADVLALAALSLRGRGAAPQFAAARRLVLEVVARLRKGPPGDEVDARALARLASASRTELREIAEALYAAKQAPAKTNKSE